MIKKPFDLRFLDDSCFRYKVDFLRRLVRLEKSLSMFFLTGRLGNLFPHLFSVYSALWSSSKVLRSDRVQKSFQADLVFGENNGRNEGTREPVRSSLSDSVQESGDDLPFEEVPESPAYGMY